jgi:SulP family sulfate permease
MFSNLKNDLIAAFNVTIVTLPTALGIGLICTSSLGPEYSVVGALAGLFGVLFATLVPPFTGSSAFQFNGPGPAAAGILSGLTVAVMAHPDVKAAGSDPAALSQVAIQAIFLCSLLVGLLHVIIAGLKLGNLIKLVPGPVITGILNGIVFLIMAYQIRKFLGVDGKAPFVDILQGSALLRLSDVITGSSSIISYIITKKFIKKIPPLVGSLAVGTVVFVLLGTSGMEMGPVIGTIPSAFPTLTQAVGMTQLVGQDYFWSLLPLIFSAAVTITLITAIGALITAATADAVSGSRHHTTGELFGLGAGNMVAALFGGIPSGGSPSRVLANYHAGGRTRMSHLAGSGMLLVAIIGLGPVIGKLPLSAVAGSLIIMATGYFDMWAISLFQKAWTTRDKTMRRNLAISAVMVLTVTVLVITSGLMTAIAVGLVIELMRYLTGAGKTLIRQSLSGAVIRSNTVRSSEEYEILNSQGGSIRLLVLQGSLFFGNTDKLAAYVDEILPETDWLLLDFNRISDLDTSAVLILKRIDDKLTRENKKMFLASLPPDSEKLKLLEEYGLVRPIEEGRIYRDRNSALAMGEEELIQREREDREQLELAAGDTVSFQGLSEAELKLLSLKKRRFKKDDLIIKQHTRANGFFTLVKGRVSIIKEDPNTGKTVHLVNFGPGVNIGEMAIFDNSGLRTANVVATTDAVLYFLSLKKFQELEKKKPALALKITSNLAGSLARRLAASADIIRALETS